MAKIADRIVTMITITTAPRFISISLVQAVQLSAISHSIVLLLCLPPLGGRRSTVHPSSSSYLKLAVQRSILGSFASETRFGSLSRTRSKAQSRPRPDDRQRISRIWTVKFSKAPDPRKTLAQPPPSKIIVISDRRSSQIAPYSLSRRGWPGAFAVVRRASRSTEQADRPSPDRTTHNRDRPTVFMVFSFETATAGDPGFPGSSLRAWQLAWLRSPLTALSQDTRTGAGHFPTDASPHLLPTR